jgi:hypothetical protein
MFKCFARIQYFPGGVISGIMKSNLFVQDAVVMSQCTPLPV